MERIRKVIRKIRFIVFFGSNAGGVIIYALTLWYCTQNPHIGYLWGTVIGRVFATIVNFFVQKKVIFESTGYSAKEVVQYIAISVLMTFINSYSMATLVEYYNFSVFWAQISLALPQALIAFLLIRLVFKPQR